MKTTHLLFDIEGKPTKPLRLLLQSRGIRHNGTLDSICRETQQAWIEYDARPGMHRPPDSKELAYLRDLGFMEEVSPQGCATCDYLALTGGGAAWIRQQLTFIHELYRSGQLIFSTYLLLGSEKTPAFEDSATLESVPENEGEMMRDIYDEMTQPMGKAHRQNQLVISPLRDRRVPTTCERFEDWLVSEPTCGNKVLLVARQPFVMADLQSIRRTLQKCEPPPTFRALLPSFQIEAIGPAANPNQPIRVFLKEVARCIALLRNERASCCPA